MTKMVSPGAAWSTLEAQAKAAVPEAFDASGQPLNLVAGRWAHPGRGKRFFSPVDGTELARYPFIDAETAEEAVEAAAREFSAWSQVDLDERRRRVADCVKALKQHRELIAKILIWEIGKPYAQALQSVDRCIEGVGWYLDVIGPMLQGRKPLGLVSNIASWNYPLSVLVHAILVQMLAGNTVIAKTPSDGGLLSLTVSLGLARRAGLPVSLVSGSGGQLSGALVTHSAVACMSFVGGKASGRGIAASLYDKKKRYMLEMEGVNAYGIWDFSQWDKLALQLKKGFDYGKQRCTAYVRLVVQRSLFPRFLETYLPLLQSLKFGNPVLVDSSDAPLPTFDFGPLINAAKVEELDGMCNEAVGGGALRLFQGKLPEQNFLPEQDASAYYPPTALLGVPRSAALYHGEPFGPVDSIVIVDRIEELVAEMNVSNGSLVASIACDDEAFAKRTARELRAFKVGINTVRSRGDRDEVFGGIGQSWKGCFVGGKYLVQAVTEGPPGEPLYGNFEDYTRVPDER